MEKYLHGVLIEVNNILCIYEKLVMAVEKWDAQTVIKINVIAGFTFYSLEVEQHKECYSTCSDVQLLFGSPLLL